MRFLSAKVHTIIGIIVGIVLLLAPSLFGFGSNQAATTVPIAVGIFIIISELVTTSPMSPLKLVPMQAHLIIDYVTGIFLAVSPWLFGFADAEMNVWLPHMVVGLVVILYALFTNPVTEPKERVAM